MSQPRDTTPVRRSDLRHALRWVLRQRQRTAFVVLLLLLAGLFSACGWLRWQLPLMRWSFAAGCWLAASLLAIQSLRLRRHSR